MNVLMFGWEFPPFFAGGVGMVCYELTKQLSKDGVSVQYVMPFFPSNLKSKDITLYNAEAIGGDVSQQLAKIKITKVHSLLGAYQTFEEYDQVRKKLLQRNTTRLYGSDLLKEIHLYALRAKKILLNNQFGEFDIIHAHDWTTHLAAMEVKKFTGKPLVIHVHITEFNKTGNNTANPEIYKIEKAGFHAADKVIAISNLVKDTLIKHYAVPQEKIELVYNGGIQMAPPNEHPNKKWLLKDKYDLNSKIVLFAGRVTAMKGPTRFVKMAKKVLEQVPNTIFVVAGTGDKLDACKNLAHELDIYEKFIFFGFYNKREAERLYDSADVFVLPSQLEPFGVTPLEAMSKKTPVVLSKQSGVAEIVHHALLNDFWDIDKMASNVISLLTYPKLHKKIAEEAYQEALQIDWKKPAKQCENLYERLMT